ncbi:MAG: beta-glucosidase BglX [Flavobacteriaceae bacterium]|nr:beta-glucosidase BglX [Flavobacteriaceae bacterium]
MQTIKHILIILFFMSYSNKVKAFVWLQQDIEQQVDSLMQKMNLEEKIGQTVLYSSGMDITGPVLDKAYKDHIKAGQVGAIFNATGAAYTRKLQKLAVEETRLGIPMLFGYDVIHGHKTIFPIPLAESCSWDLELAEKSARISAIEAAADGLHWTFSPMVDISRDARWGRVSEGAGEDVYLASLIARAKVIGYQGDLKQNNTILSCAKHFAAYGAPQAGRDYHTVDMSEIRLRNTFLPPFKAALDAGAASFMTAFNELNGVPATGNPFLLDEILRKEWGFRGFVVTDYTSINEMTHHGYAAELKHAGELAMNAGVDMDMQGGVYKNHLLQSIQEGKVSEARLDEAVRAILRMKFKLGLFEDPYRYCNEETAPNILMAPEHMEFARELAQRSIVLLKNHQEVLPLAKQQKIALIGPMATDEVHILGSWAAQGDRAGKAVSLKEGMEVHGLRFAYAQGCEILKDYRVGFEQAIALAKDSDVVVMAMGEAEYMSGEAASRTNIQLPAVQRELIAEIKKTGKPIVLVLYNGRPLDLTWENQTVDAILEAWFPGTNGGLAVADILVGEYNPSAKLTLSFPRNIGQIPIFYNQKNTGRPADAEGAHPRYSSKYIDADNSPLFAFGYGLSYTKFIYENIALSHDKLGPNNSISISVEVTNIGDRAGEEIVQLYIRDMVGSITRPVKELKGFQKITLQKGERQTIRFTIEANDLKFYNKDLEFVVEEGDFLIGIGGSSEVAMKHSFTYSNK